MYSLAIAGIILVMKNAWVGIVLGLLLVVGGVAVWRIASVHQIRTAVPAYSFELDPAKDITQIVKPEVGDVILLTGNEMAAAGYEWVQENIGDDAVYRVVDMVTETGNPDSKIVGGASRVSIRIKIVGEGRATAMFKHMKQFGDQDTTGSFTLQFE